MAVCNQHGIKAQVLCRPTGAVHAILSLHSGYDYACATPRVQLLRQFSHEKGAGPALVEDNFVTPQLQLLNDLCQWAAGLDWRTGGASVPGQKNRGVGLSGIAHQAVQCAYERLRLPGLVRTLNQTYLHIENQQCIHRAFLACEPAITRHKKGPVHCWRAFEVRLFSAHDTSHGPPCAVVVVVVVEALRCLLMDIKVVTRPQLGKRRCKPVQCKVVPGSCPS